MWRWSRLYQQEWGVKMLRHRDGDWRLLVKLGRASFSVGNW
jgi:hypothetical protein